MIIRVWRGRTAVADADRYEHFLKETAYPDYGEVPGNRGWILLRRSVSESVEFMFVSFWDSMDALAA
jgi:heme-degrading monooxygenase HmoA